MEKDKARACINRAERILGGLPIEFRVDLLKHVDEKLSHEEAWRLVEEIIQDDERELDASTKKRTSSNSGE